MTKHLGANTGNLAMNNFVVGEGGHETTWLSHGLNGKQNSWTKQSMTKKKHSSTYPLQYYHPHSIPFSVLATSDPPRSINLEIPLFQYIN